MLLLCFVLDFTVAADFGGSFDSVCGIYAAPVSDRQSDEPELPVMKAGINALFQCALWGVVSVVCDGSVNSVCVEAKERQKSQQLITRLGRDSGTDGCGVLKFQRCVSD